MELNCPSLDYVNNMTWAEFQIRSYGWKRQDERESYKLRKVGFSAMWAFHSDFKKLPRSEDKYWQIGDKHITTNNSMQEAIRKAQEEYFKQLKEKEQNG